MLQKFELIYSCVTHLQCCFNFDKVKGVVRLHALLCFSFLFGLLGVFFGLLVCFFFEEKLKLFFLF